MENEYVSTGESPLTTNTTFVNTEAEEPEVVYNRKLNIWVDTNLNTWLGNKTLQEAVNAAHTLKDCTKCHECYSCTDCRSCEFCSACVKCITCNDCSSCSGASVCQQCSDCAHVYQCSRCHDCDNCFNCIDCSAITGDRITKGMSYGFINTTKASGHPVLSTEMPSMRLLLDSEGQFDVDVIKGKNAAFFSNKYELLMRECYKALTNLEKERLKSITSFLARQKK